MGLLSFLWSILLKKAQDLGPERGRGNSQHMEVIKVSNRYIHPGDKDTRPYLYKVTCDESGTVHTVYEE